MFDDLMLRSLQICRNSFKVFFSSESATDGTGGVSMTDVTGGVSMTDDNSIRKDASRIKSSKGMLNFSEIT